MATELYIEPERRYRNAINGQFLNGNTPHNKGKKWNEWMDMRKAKRVKRIGMRNLHGRSDIGGWNARPVFAIDKEGNTVGWFASSYDAERTTGKYADYSVGDSIGTCLKHEYCLTSYSNKTAKLLKVLKPEEFATPAEIEASRFFRMIFK